MTDQPKQIDFFKFLSLTRQLFGQYPAPLIAHELSFAEPVSSLGVDLELKACEEMNSWGFFPYKITRDNVNDAYYGLIGDVIAGKVSVKAEDNPWSNLTL